MATISRGFNNLGKIAATIQPFVEDTLDHGVITLIEVADPLTPVDTGALKANKAIEKKTMARDVIWLQSYAAYQEFGTSRGVPAKKFGATGADAAIEVINDRLGRWEGSL